MRLSSTSVHGDHGIFAAINKAYIDATNAAPISSTPDIESNCKTNTYTGADGNNFITRYCSPIIPQ
jgi:hypothetical protein